MITLSNVKISNVKLTNANHLMLIFNDVQQSWWNYEIEEYFDISEDIQKVLDEDHTILHVKIDKILDIMDLKFGLEEDIQKVIHSKYGNPTDHEKRY